MKTHANRFQFRQKIEGPIVNLAGPNERTKETTSQVAVPCLCELHPLIIHACQFFGSFCVKFWKQSGDGALGTWMNPFYDLLWKNFSRQIAAELLRK